MILTENEVIEIKRLLELAQDAISTNTYAKHKIKDVLTILNK